VGKGGWIEPLHSPPHFFVPNYKYIVTGATYQKRSFMSSDKEKEIFLRTLIDRSEFEEWKLEAWAVLSNHYYFIAQAPKSPTNLSSMIRAIHSISGKYFNHLDSLKGRRVWYNYWDTCITHGGLYLARLHYVHVNPVKHGLVDCPEDYSFCSYDWFMRNSEKSFRDSVLQQPMELINIRDDF